jgi:hypothetical protein
MTSIALTRRDLGDLLHVVAHTPYMERPTPTTTRKLMRAFVRAGGDLTEIEGDLPDLNASYTRSVRDRRC